MPICIVDVQNITRSYYSLCLGLATNIWPNFCCKSLHHPT